MCEKGEFEGNIQIMPSNNNIIKQFIDNVFAKKRHCNKGAFQQIPTSKQGQFFLGMTYPIKLHIQTYF